MIISNSGGLKKLAPDLTRPSDIGGDSYVTITGVDTSAGLTEVLGLSGKFDVNILKLTGMLDGTVTVKLTVDGVVIWNDTFPPNTNIHLVGQALAYAESFQCESSLSLEVHHPTDSSINLLYSVRPLA